MTTAVRTPDPTRCPDCRTALQDRDACTACGLALQGPPAARLWEVDTALLRLGDEQDALLAERRGLLAQLRTGPPRAASPATRSPATPVPPAEWTPQRVQNTLLSLGGLLLGVAALVFTAVTYDRLGAGGRAVVLLVLTALVAVAVPRVLQRGLSATAETLTAVLVALAALDAYGLYRLGAGDEPLTYAAASAAVVAALAASYARVVPVRLAGGAAVVAAQLPVPLLLVEDAASGLVCSVAFAALAAADLLALVLLRRQVRRHVQVLLAGAAATATALGLLLSLSSSEARPFGDALALLAHAAVLAGAGLLVRARTPRALLWAAPVAVLALAADALAAPELTSVQRPLVAAAVALLAVQAAALLPAGCRPGPVLGAVVVAAGAVVAVTDSAVAGLLLPLTWALEPWTLADGASARDAVGTTGRWDGSVVTTVVLGAAAVTAGAAGLALQRVRESLAPTAVLLAATVVLLPLGLAVSFPSALALLLAVGAGLLVGAALLLPRPLGQALAGCGTAVVLLACAWSLADRQATLTVLAVGALVLAGLASRRLPQTLLLAATGLAAVLATGELVAAGAARDLAGDQVGGLLLVAVAALLGVAAVLERTRSQAVDAVAVVAGVVAAVLAGRDPGWLSWVLTGLGLLALATALRPARRAAATAGALLLAAASWVRLADAGVTAPEPYVVPLGLVALALGHLRARAVPGTRSWSAYGPGLSLLLLPSLLASLDDRTPTRPLLVGAAALVVLLVGARERLQAPLVLGGVVLAVDALRLVGPYAAALPRWSTIGLAGTLLVVVGATYEQRRREVDRLREAYASLS